jgi:hypothetical protein
MIALGLLFLRLLCDRFKPQQQLEAEILMLRHQLNILQHRAPGRPHLRWADRCVYRKLKLGHNGDAVRQGSRGNGYFQLVELGARKVRPYLASDAFAIRFRETQGN